LNIGYAEQATDLKSAQAEMCRRTAASLPRPGRWLDVGCGVGGPACLLARENPEVDITGINIVPGHLAAASERAATDQDIRDRVRFQYGDACAMPFTKKDCFDGVYAIETAFHYADKDAFAREVARVLRPGGCFACADVVIRPNGLRWWERPLLTISHRVIASPEMYTVPQWQTALEKAGLTDVRVTDISKQTFSLLKDWADQLRAIKPQLVRRYPRMMLIALDLGLRYMNARLNDYFLAYVMLTARKPMSTG